MELHVLIVLPTLLAIIAEFVICMEKGRVHAILNLLALIVKAVLLTIMVLPVPSTVNRTPLAAVPELVTQMAIVLVTLHLQEKIVRNAHQITMHHLHVPSIVMPP